MERSSVLCFLPIYHTDALTKHDVFDKLWFPRAGGMLGLQQLLYSPETSFDAAALCPGGWTTEVY